ncbi:MAG TPA: YggS family pyridoxal phosphate-dependent enzyme [Herpetosiphonaceae bacterium]
MELSQQIAQNIAAVRERIAAAARRAGRSPQEITLIAVTKTHAPQIIEAALAAGVGDCGENRVQEAEAKIEALGHERTRWHLIGHLQRNKARRAVALFDMIHSLDSVKLAEALNRHVEEDSSFGSLRLPVLLQVNVSGEPTKEGFDLVGGVENRAALADLVRAVGQIADLPQLEVQGLMTIAPYDPDPEVARPVFRALRRLRDELARQVPQASWRHLSMGMTGDFEVAIEEGATLVRVGRAIFGERE